MADFREFVLYGDLDQEMDEDEGLQIDDDHLTAFKVCQFSAQYLDHCVETLSQRLEGYSDDYRVLGDTRSRLTRTNRSLVRVEFLKLTVVVQILPYANCMCRELSENVCKRNTTT